MTSGCCCFVLSVCGIEMNSVKTTQNFTGASFQAFSHWTSHINNYNNIYVFYICREIISNTQWNHLDRTLQFESDSLEYDFRLRLELCDVLKVKRPLVMHSVSALSCLQVRIRGELVLKQCYVSSLMLRPSKSLLPCPYGLSIGLESRSLMGMNCTPFAL